MPKRKHSYQIDQNWKKMRPKDKKRDIEMGETHIPTTVTTDLKHGKEKKFNQRKV